jgi:predicted neuraminidase
MIPARFSLFAAAALAVAAAQTTPVSVERLDGSRLVIRNYAEHRATVLVFLSARDPAADPVRGMIRELSAKLRRSGVIFAAIFPNPAETGDEIRRFCQASGFVLPCYRDPKGEAVRALGAKVTPEAFVLDRMGTVRYRGAPAGLEEAIRNPSAPSVEASGAPIGASLPPRRIDDPYGSISYSAELIFEKIPEAAAHHASSITEAANGDLLVTWYGGSYESSDDEALYFARRRKGARYWDPPRMLLRNPEHPVGNAVIFTTRDGRVWIIWGRIEATQPLRPHGGWDSTRLMMRVSTDNGNTWSKDTLFPMDTAGWLPRNVAIRLQSGATMVPVSDERNNRDLSFFLITRDNGATWTRSENIPNSQPQGEQPAVAQRQDGSLLAFLRTAPRLLQTESSDGIRWSPAKVTGFKNPDAAISLCALNNGRLLLVWNNNERGRSPLHIARSTDNGATWSPPLMLESNPGEYSYPSVIQTRDGKIHVVYTYRRYSIKHVEFNEDWLIHMERPD